MAFALTSWRRRSAPTLSALLATVAVNGLGCGGASSGPSKAPSPAPREAGAPSSAASVSSHGFVPIATPSMLLPDLAGDSGVVSEEEGYRRVLRDRMRLIVREDGSMERAAELIGVSGEPISSLELPSRLGGGYLFYVNAGTGPRGAGMQIYRASSWLGKLEPLVQLSTFVSDIIPGFDRLYLRVDVSNKLLAIDPQSGRELPLGPLPPASAYGPLAFADGWRAVVDTDLRGPLATFDAGATWRPVSIPDRVASAAVLRGDAVLVTPASTQYAIDAHGVVTLRVDPAASEREPADVQEPARSPGLLGRRPLRAALEDGWPDGDATAVVARGGALARVSLRDGSIVETAPDAYPEPLAACHAIALGHGFGFVCGEQEGATNVYAFAPPLSMQRVLHFAKPRFVASSGNGALVIRGGCAADDEPVRGKSSYCVRGVDGKVRGVVVRSDFSERVVALGDGRVVIVVPPRADAKGQLAIVTGRRITQVPLAIPAEPRSTAREVKRGMWLEAFEEREPGVLGGWIEAGGPIVGVRITLDGAVTMGEVRDSFEDRVVVGGRFAVAELPEGRGAESVDGGMTWSFFEMPVLPQQEGAATTRACGPAGCALERWLRVGWGKPRADGDFVPAEAPAPLSAPLKVSPTLSFRCDTANTPSSLPPEKPVGRDPRRAPAVPTHRRAPPSMNSWVPFRGVAPPAVAKDELGLDNGNVYAPSALRAYAWGKKGADWSRSGRWLIRYDDRFDLGSGVRSSAVTTSPWPDEAAAAEALGTTAGYGSAQWISYPDPSGRSMLAAACRGILCSLYAVSEGQPILAIRDASGHTGSLPRILPSGAVRVGETWLFAASSYSARGASFGAQSSESIAVYRVDLGVARLLATLNRPIARPNSAPPPAPRLVRRAFGGGAGLLIETAEDPGERSGGWHVVPIDLDTGKLGDPIYLGRRDLGGAALARCSPKQDGWLFDTSVMATTAIDFTGGSAQLQEIEYRLRVDPGSACIDGLATTVEGSFASAKSAPPPAKSSPDPVDPIPLAATEWLRSVGASGRRWGFQCKSVKR